MPPLCPHPLDPETQCNWRKSSSRPLPSAQWGNFAGTTTDRQNWTPTSRIERRRAKRRWIAAVAGAGRERDWRVGIGPAATTGTWWPCRGSRGRRRGCGFPVPYRTWRSTRRSAASVVRIGNCDAVLDRIKFVEHRLKTYRAGWMAWWYETCCDGERFWDWWWERVVWIVNSVGREEKLERRNFSWWRNGSWSVASFPMQAEFCFVWKSKTHTQTHLTTNDIKYCYTHSLLYRGS